MRGAWRVFELSLGEMLWSRRTVFLAIVVGCPVLVAAGECGPVEEVTSPDDNLQAVFKYLVKT